MASMEEIKSENSDEDLTKTKLTSRFGQLEVLDDLIRLRASDEEQVPILAYPKIEGNDIVYDLFTGKDLNEFISNGVAQLEVHGFRRPVLTSQTLDTFV